MYFMRRFYINDAGDNAVETAGVTEHQVLLDTVECWLEKGFKSIEIYDQKEVF